ncbi:MAG: type II toxin-antitoxin system RelE/ParE family toxin [Proteobacteria bacterium]|nr:type II toxin-antitoxin system RelE/ParE family toxin [Pseudomonadota bacterium]
MSIVCGRRQRLSDAALCEAVREMRHGSYEADLGGGLLKKRIARVLTMPPAFLATAENAGELTEVNCDGEETLKDS